jgi:hypothetical protein
MVGGSIFFGVFDLLSFGGCNFLIFNLFSRVVSVSDVRRGGVQV